MKETTKGKGKEPVKSSATVPGKEEIPTLGATLLGTMQALVDGPEPRRICALLIDETMKDSSNFSKDRGRTHACQAAVLRWCAQRQQKVIASFQGGVPANLAKELGELVASTLPKDTVAIQKATDQSDAFTNPALKGTLEKRKITDVIIMGQSTNACCLQTAVGASKLGLTVHTCMQVLRGGQAESKGLLYVKGYPQYSWPRDTKLYKSVE